MGDMFAAAAEIKINQGLIDQWSTTIANLRFETREPPYNSSYAYLDATLPADRQTVVNTPCEANGKELFVKYEGKPPMHFVLQPFL